MTVSCPCCLREERWRGEERVVVTAGGKRRPEGPPELAAWDTALASLRGGPVVVGRCPACDQPLVAAAPARRAPWTVPLPGGPLVVLDRVTADGVELSADEADRRVRAAFPHGGSAGRTAVQGAMILPMFAPIVMWPVALFVAMWILFNAMWAGMNGGGAP